MAGLEANNLSLPEYLYRSIRAAILDGTYEPGEELRQEVLANKYGVSRVPLREALSRLQAEGLIVLRPRRGFSVQSMDLVGIMEIFELRMVVEQHAMEVAARVRSEADVREVEALLKEMEALSPASPGYLSEWLKINHMFHHRLIASSGRDRVVEIASNLRDSTEAYVRLEANATGHVDNASDEHRQLFEAFAARDSIRAGAISREHCLGTMKRLVAGLRQANEGRPRASSGSRRPRTA